MQVLKAIMFTFLAIPMPATAALPYSTTSLLAKMLETMARKVCRAAADPMEKTSPGMPSPTVRSPGEKVNTGLSRCRYR